MTDPKFTEPRLAITLRVFLPFACGYFLSYLYRTVNAVISPDLVSDLSLDATDLGLLTSMYFLTFAAFQLPLGMLLDRFGPRRVEAVLLLFAAAGAACFALSARLEGLIVGRALIGFGVSACLMASFKAFVVWFPPQRWPAVNGWVMAAGGLGALTATAPVELALGFTDWRGLFLGLSLATLAVAALIFLVVPEHTGPVQRESFRAQWRGVGEVFANRYFWRVAPITTFSQAAYLSIQGLWAGPWLRDVAGLERAVAANHLLAIAAAMVAGYLIMGNLAYRLARFGIQPITVAVTGMAIFVLIQAAIILGFIVSPLVIWIAFGFFGTSGIVAYAGLSQAFPTHLAGRVNTGINLLVFVVAFAGQWGIGAIINLWSVEAGSYHPSGFQAAFGLVFMLQAGALAWYLLSGYLARHRP
jgi:MFS family permease